MREPLYSAEEMRAAEAQYRGYPDTAPELMARAGAAVAELVALRFPAARRVTAVCGGGANGGDGRIAAELLAARGLEVTVVDTAAGGDLGSPDVIIDALFGTGFQGEPRPEAARLIEAIGASDAPVVAVDVPSGVDASTGEVAGVAVTADLTVTFHGQKVGLAVAPGRFHAGEVVVVDIGLELAGTEHGLVTRAVLGLVPHRGARDNKYSSGSVLVLGGSPGLTGAVCLAAEAAFRADAGYVTVVAPPESLPVLETRLLEAVKRPFDELEDAVTRADALALGPGLGRGTEGRSLVRLLLASSDRPAVVDADGLYELEPFRRDAPTVLTPHAGELGQLLGEESAWVSAHRLDAVQRAADSFNCVVLLKGADTLVAAPGEGVLVCGFGPPSLATAGTGDVLTGVIAAFLAKGLGPRLAAAAAAVAHGLAAAAVPEQVGLIASDVIRELPRVLSAPL